MGLHIYEHKGLKAITNISHMSEEAVVIAREWQKTLVLRSPMMKLTSLLLIGKER